MNQIRIEEGRAILSLVKTQRRLSHEYAAWAREDEASGKLDRADRYSREAKRLWESAKWYITFARSRVYGQA